MTLSARDHVLPRGLIAFHDYFHYCPGVKQCVKQLLLSGRGEFVTQSDTLVAVAILRQSPLSATLSTGHAESADAQAAAGERYDAIGQYQRARAINGSGSRRHAPAGRQLRRCAEDLFGKQPLDIVAARSRY